MGKKYLFSCIRKELQQQNLYICIYIDEEKNDKPICISSILVCYMQIYHISLLYINMAHVIFILLISIDKY